MLALLKKECNRALYVHCFAHSFNLCLQFVAKKCEIVRSVLEFIFELVQLIKFSPIHLSLFDSMRKVIAINSGEIPTPSLRTLCPTCWTVRHEAINSMLPNYKDLLKTLNEIQKETDYYAAKLGGFYLNGNI